MFGINSFFQYTAIKRKKANKKENKLTKTVSDLFIIGGGVNGCGIARDAAGRGLSVVVAEMSDLGSATSSSVSYTHLTLPTILLV